MDFPSWVCAGITLISAAVSFAYAVADLRGAAPAAKNSSRYALSRSTALLVAAVVALFVAAPAFTAAVAVAMILVQALDAVVDGIAKNAVKTWGPAATALANAATLAWMLAA